MKKHPTTLAAAIAIVLAIPAGAQDARPAAAPSPGQIVAEAPASAWVPIAPDDLLVMTLAPKHAGGEERQAIIQLMPAPFSQGWIGNIRKLAAAHWWDGLAIVRVQDNYVVQWGDPDGENPGKARPLPPEMATMGEDQYVYPAKLDRPHALDPLFSPPNTIMRWASFYKGWPVAGVGTPDTERNWPVHCYGMVGVGRNYSPDTGTGAELYTVIGQAPRHLDRNIALVGRVIEGMENLSSLPRGHGELGFYDPEMGDHRVPIVSIRLASELPSSERPRFEYLSTESDSFARYIEARANRRDPFFITPAGGVEICNAPVPVRRVNAE